MGFGSEHNFNDIHGHYSSIDTGKVRITGAETYDELVCTVLSIIDEKGNEERKQISLAGCTVLPESGKAPKDIPEFQQNSGFPNDKSGVQSDVKSECFD